MWHGQIEFHPSLTWTSPSPWEYAGHIDAKRGKQMICNDTGALELYLYNRSFSIGRYTYASRTERFAGPQVSPCSNSCCTVNGGVCSWRYEILLFSFSMVQFLDFLPRQAPLGWHKLTVFSTWNVCSEDFVQTRVVIPTQLRIHSPFQLLGVNVLSLGNCASLRWKQYEPVAKPCLRWNRCSMIFIRCLNSKMSDTTHIRILSLYTCLSIHIRIWKAWWLYTSKWSALWWCIMRRLSSKGDTNGDLNNGTPLPVHKSSPVAIAKLKGSVGLNDPGQRELLKLCLSLTLAWSMVHGPSWSNSCSFTLLHAPSWSFVVLHVQNEMCGRAQLPATSCLWSKLATPAHEIAVTAFIQGVLHKHGTLFPRRVGNRNHHICPFSMLRSISNLRKRISHLPNKWYVSLLLQFLAHKTWHTFLYSTSMGVVIGNPNYHKQLLYTPQKIRAT